MTSGLSVKDLIAFEDDVAALFLQKKLPFPIHLSGGNEQELIDIFAEHVRPQDWICGTWRFHYHCLLKGVPAALVRSAILTGHSITLGFPAYRVISSAMVGGIAPIAVGLALGIQRKGEAGRRGVVCFLGDMAAMTGIVQESMHYAAARKLPLLWVVENNGLSVCTNTVAAWGSRKTPNVIGYQYQMSRPHVGAGRFVTF